MSDTERIIFAVIAATAIIVLPPIILVYLIRRILKINEIVGLLRQISYGVNHQNREDIIENTRKG